jgi:hypothetical protein
MNDFFEKQLRSLRFEKRRARVAATAVALEQKIDFLVSQEKKRIKDEADKAWSQDDHLHK